MNKKTIERLDKFLAHAGITSRKNIKQLLKKNEVTVNGKRVTSSGVRISLNDEVKINGQTLAPAKHLYLMLNKPPGIVSTTDTKTSDTTVIDLIDIPEKIYPIGRLDKDTRGLILLTNDGELTHKLIHPKYHVPKVYQLTVQNKITDEQLEAFRTGVLLKDGITLPAQAKIVRENKDTTMLEVVLHEGRNRQIRRMCETVGMELIDLKRTQFGPIKLGKLKEGEWRELTEAEIKELNNATKPRAISSPLVGEDPRCISGR